MKENFNWEQLLKSTFWEKAWEQAGEIRKEKKMGPDAVEAWNKRAENFSQNVESTEGSDRTEAVLNFLKSEGAMQNGFTVIDIGCGPGTITIPLARQAGFVVALEPATAMLHKLQARAAREGLQNIKTVAERWQDTDLEKKHWTESFDLAFASMSPGVAGAEDLQKLMKASRRYCYLSTFAGRRDETRDTLWQKVLGKPYPASDLDVAYPFNLLYTWGYRPSLRFFHHQRSDWLPVEKVAADMKQYLQGTIEIDTNIENKIISFLQEKASNSYYFYCRESFQGMLIWDKNIRFSY